jgi:histidinol-phosphate aminotransferase
MRQNNPAVTDWVRPEICALSAYPVPDARGLIKLDAMENPYTWPEGLRQAWLKRLHSVDVNRYPDPRAAELKQRLRVNMSVPAAAEIILGNGSDELIQMIAMTLARLGQVLLSVEPGFVMYRMIAVFTGMRYEAVALKAEDFSLDAPALLAAIERHRPAVVFLAYPNNPTGNLFNEADLVQVIEAAPGLVVVDEAYAPFTDASFMHRVGQFGNLLVLRTLSKMGLAGLRLGLLAGPSAWMSEIEKTRLPYNINTLTQLSAEFALSHQDVFDEQTRAIRGSRQALFGRLAGLSGVTAFPSAANFILLRLAEGRASPVHASLKSAGVLVKNLHGAHPLLRDCLRVTVGTPDENQAFLEALTAALG